MSQNQKEKSYCDRTMKHGFWVYPTRSQKKKNAAYLYFSKAEDLTKAYKHKEADMQAMQKRNQVCYRIPR